jgi:cell division transport system permease protein
LSRRRSFVDVLRILGHFSGEALASLCRSWRISLLAMLTIATSVFVAGTFWLLSSNLSRIVGDWRQAARVVIYLSPGASPEEIERVADRIERAPWVVEVEHISESQARDRFERTFPSVEDLLESWQGESLPASLEVSFDPDLVQDASFDSWQAAVRQDPAVLLVDDDRDWLRQLDALIALLRGLGLVLGTALLMAAMVSIASVIRLTAYLYRDEIAVMRLVGATEFYVRGPFYFEGLIQGLLGGALALAGLYVAFFLLGPQPSSAMLLGTVLIDSFLPVSATLALLGIAALAGLFGAVISLRRETLAED